MYLKRTRKELGDIAKDPLIGIELGCKGDDMCLWYAVIQGLEDSPYEGGKFSVNIKLPEDYPFKPPKIEMVTKILHPNVSKEGDLCCCNIEILRD